VNSRIASWLLGIVAIAAVACIDMSAPKGPFSISVLLVPSPGLVVGDVMRDSNGVPAPLGLTAFDAGGGTLPVTPDFFVTDSLRFAHIGPGLILMGDSVGTVHLLGQIGNLQTAVVSVAVSPAPTTFVAAPTPNPSPDTILVPVGADSASSLGHSTVTVSLKGRGDSAVAGFVVKFVLRSGPATVSTSKFPAVYLAGDDGKISLRDTTDGSGLASRNIFVNSRALADSALLAGTKTDSAVVEATTSYKGVPIGVPVHFSVPIRIKFGT
jgi:hypothetical protein